jgi:hypothetical protein
MDESPVFFFGEEEMIEKKLLALKDVELKNAINCRSVIEGQVFSFKFKDKWELESILSTGNFELVLDVVQDSREVPDVLPDEDIEEEVRNLDLSSQDSTE